MGKLGKITPETYKRILESMRMDYKWYVLKDSSDISDYDIINGNDFGLPVDIAVDYFHNYRNKGIPYHMYFRNGYNRQNEWIAVSVDDDPHVFGKPKIKIAKSDLQRVKLFVKRHKEQLIRIATDDIIANCEQVLLSENREILTELAILTPEETGLSRKLWIDNGGTYKQGGHWIRVKVESPKGKDSSRGWTTYNLGTNEWIKGDECDIKKKEEKEIEKFISLNIEMITKATIENWSGKDIRDSIIRIDGKTAPKKRYRPEHDEWVVIKEAGFGINMVKHTYLPDRYNYEKEGEILFTDFKGLPYMFEFINPFRENGYARARLQGVDYWVNIHGHIKPINSDKENEV